MTIWEKDFTAIKLERNGAWVTLWLNRPDAKNALSGKMTSELIEALSFIASDKMIRGVALRGVNGCFCAGADLKEFERNFVSTNATREQIIKMSTGVAELFKRVYTMPQIVVALVEGSAFAGGFGLVCCSDFVLGTRAAKFSISETKIGLTPAQIAPYIIERIGKRNTKNLMLSGNRFTGTEAHHYGVIDQLAKNEIDLEDQFSKLKQSLKACAPEATAVTKEILISLGQIKSAEMTPFLANKFADCMTSREAKEGLQAFSEKRKPKWAEL
jgi:isohexenylglutaconyl-CoA hydratase